MTDDDQEEPKNEHLEVDDEEELPELQEGSTARSISHRAQYTRLSSCLVFVNINNDVD